MEPDTAYELLTNSNSICPVAPDDVLHVGRESSIFWGKCNREEIGNPKNPVAPALQGVDVDALKPLDALQLLAKWQGLVSGLTHQNFEVSLISVSAVTKMRFLR